MEFLKRESAPDTSKPEFDKLHRAWCTRIVAKLESNEVKTVTFGSAAKLLAMYSKAMVVVGGGETSSLARVAHPAIDRILLRNMSRSRQIKSPFQQSWGKANWTQLTKAAYYRLLAELATCLEDDEPMWVLERYWTVTNERVT